MVTLSLNVTQIQVLQIIVCKQYLLVWAIEIERLVPYWYISADLAYDFLDTYKIIFSYIHL